MSVNISRESYLEKLIASDGDGMIKIVTGLRRCGKSYLLFNLFRKHLKESGVRDDHVVEIALDQMAHSRHQRRLRMRGDAARGARAQAQGVPRGQSAVSLQLRGAHRGL